MLVCEYGEAKTLDFIDQLDSYIASNGEGPKGSHCATIERWIKREKKTPSKGGSFLEDAIERQKQLENEVVVF